MKTSQTILEVTLRIGIGHDEGPLDVNSVKALIREGTTAIADNVDILDTINNGKAGSICVEVIKLKENGKRQALSTYGTDDVPWGRD